MGPIDRWIQENEERQGHYAALAGFEADLRKRGELLAAAYDDMDLYAQIALFGFVAGLDVLC